MAKTPVQPEIVENISSIEMSEVLDDRYTTYAYMSLEDRALPDARDGLKPSQRRVIVAMNDLGLRAGGGTEKCAKICGDCFVEGTLVATPKGLVPIEKIVKGDFVCTQEGNRKVIETYFMPKRPLLKIELEDGRTVICTNDQMFKVFTPDMDFVWRKSSDLRPDDYIVSKTSTTEKGIKSDAHDLKELAYVLGYFLADGWLIHDIGRPVPRVCFADESVEVLEEVSRIIKKHTGYNCNIRKVRNKLYEIRVNKNDVNEFLINHLHIDLAKKSKNIRIPDWILTGGKEIAAGFISGYWDGDGCISNKCSHASATSISQDFICELQTLLLSLGIFSTVREANKTYESHVNGRSVKNTIKPWHIDIYGSSLQSFFSFVNLFNDKRRIRLDQHCQSRKFFGQYQTEIPYLWKDILHVFQTSHLGGGWYQNSTGDKIRCGLKYETGTKIRYSHKIDEMSFNMDVAKRLGILEKCKALGYEKAISLLSYIESNNLFFSKVKKINKEQPRETFDIQVEDRHELVVNGLIAHNCSGNYHPHGEAVVYPTMYRMAQWWNLRYSLLAGQGNFGNIDGDPPAAMRYTEAKFSRFGEMMVEDLSPDVVDFVSNYNEKRMEPVILPSKLPNLLVNGCAGIAVGWATSIAPHNLREVVEVIKAYIKNKDITCEEILSLMPGPDFPTGGKILGQSGVLDYYKTGRGSIKMEGSYSIEKDKKGVESITITHLPYQTPPSKMIKQIEELVEKDELQGISDLKDLSSKKDGLKIVIWISKGHSAEIVANHLLKRTCLRETFSVNQTVLIGGKVVSEAPVLKLVEAFVNHRKTILTRKFKAEQVAHEKRLHILEGLLKVAANIDQVIAIIRASDGAEDAANKLIASSLITTKEQAQAVLAITLKNLTKLESGNLVTEQAEKQERLAWLKDTLAHPEKIEDLIISEQEELARKFGDDRRSEIQKSASDINIEDLIKDENIIISLTGDGYVRSIPIADYRIQGRGGRGSAGISKKQENDDVFEMFEAKSKDLVLFFSNLGYVYQKRAYEIPKSSRTSKGMHVSNLLSLAEKEIITNMISVRTLDQEGSLVFITRAGLIKKSEIRDYDTVQKNRGITAIKINDGDQVAFVMLTDGKKDIFIVTAHGSCVRYSESIVPTQGRATAGSRAMKLESGDSVAQAFCLSPSENPDILVVTSGGFGKKTSSEEYKSLSSRQVKGYSVLKKTTLQQNGWIVGACAISEENSLLVMTSNGKVIRIPGAEIRKTGRTTTGVRLLKMESGESVIKVAKTTTQEEESEIEAETVQAH